MKKIFFLTNTFFPEHGAAPNRLLNTALGLQKAGYKVEVLTGIPNYPYGKFYKGYKSKFYQKESYQGITIHRFWLYPSHSDSYFERFLTMFSLAVSTVLAIPILSLKNVQYLFLQYPPIAMVFPTLLLKKITKAKLIVNVSDLWPIAIEELGFTKQKSLVYWAMKKIEKKAYKEAELLLAQSNEIKAYLETITNKSNILLYRTGVDTSLFKNECIKTDGTKKIKIVYAGVLGVAHGISQLCKHIKLPNNSVELHIYGEGFERKEIENHIKENQVSNIFLHKMYAQKELPEHLLAADIILIAQKTRIYGTVPSKIYDAMAMAKPILFHGAGEGEEIIRNVGCGLISKPSDFSKLNKNLKTLVESSQSFRDKMGKKGRKAAIEKFDRKIYLNSLIKALKELELSKVPFIKNQTYAKNTIF